MKNISSLTALLLAGALISCRNKPAKQAVTEGQYAKGTFGYDLDFLKQHDSVVVLNNNAGTGQVIVSAKYQAKVFTSTADGLNGKSFGWINYKTFSQKALNPHMNAYGGEDRLWTGPEGGKFALFFKPNTPMKMDYWHTPAAVDFEEWKLVSKSNKEALLTKTTRITNYQGTVLDIRILREIKVIEAVEVQKLLDITLDNRVKLVAFSTKNTLINAGNTAWDTKTGAPCLWDLDMFTPSPKTVIVIPFNASAPGRIATTDYFGEIPKERLNFKDGVFLFKADGKSRGKLGVTARRAKNRIGSYDAANNVLTVAMFDVDPGATYLNQEWRTDRNPFKGDAVNAYNDGPLKDGTHLGPFYEIESVSPAAFLKPGQSLVHKHSVFHFTGDKEELNQVALKTLGISLSDIQAAF